MKKLTKDAQDGGEIAAITRKNIEQKIGKKVVTNKNLKYFKTNIQARSIKKLK